MTEKVAPVARYVFTCADGSTIVRDYEIGETPPLRLRDVPEWLEDPHREWGHPQDPILFTGKVKAGFEDEARAALA